VVIPDLFPQRLWLVSEADAMAVASEQTRRTCEQRGIRAERLHVCGVPVELRFSAPVDRPALRRQLGLDPSRTTLLLASGGMGYGPLEPLVKTLLATESSIARRLQVLVVCGHHDALAQRLTRRCADAPFPVRVFGFVETMPELMQASDLMVTKAGGLTVMEALAVGLPMVLCGTIPGQESFNAEYVVAHGAAVDAAHPAEAVAKVLQLLGQPQRLEAMRHAAKSLSRPHAADDIAALVSSS
ncbi:MAG: glycosyltransferase, partial [Candidatus Omnitrophica bacterium]|nr:glycosyltransferase [Candidatus Omnitrophota bacterium]